MTVRSLALEKAWTQ